MRAPRSGHLKGGMLTQEAQVLGPCLHGVDDLLLTVIPEQDDQF